MNIQLVALALVFLLIASACFAVEGPTSEPPPSSLPRQATTPPSSVRPSTTPTTASLPTTTLPTPTTQADDLLSWEDVVPIGTDHPFTNYREGTDKVQAVLKAMGYELSYDHPSPTSDAFFAEHISRDSQLSVSTIWDWPAPAKGLVDAGTAKIGGRVFGLIGNSFEPVGIWIVDRDLYIQIHVLQGLDDSDALLDAIFDAIEADGSSLGVRSGMKWTEVVINEAAQVHVSTAGGEEYLISLPFVPESAGYKPGVPLTSPRTPGMIFINAHAGFGSIIPTQELILSDPELVDTPLVQRISRADHSTSYLVVFFDEFWYLLIAEDAVTPNPETAALIASSVVSTGVTSQGVPILATTQGSGVELIEATVDIEFYFEEGSIAALQIGAPCGADKTEAFPHGVAGCVDGREFIFDTQGSDYLAQAALQVGFRIEQLSP